MKIENTRSFHQFFDIAEKIPLVKSIFTDKTIKSVLDIGHGIMPYPFYLYHHYNFNHYLGIELRGFDELIKETIETYSKPEVIDDIIKNPQFGQKYYNETISSLKGSTNMYDVYSSNFFAKSDQPKWLKKRILSKESFFNIFKYKNIGANEFLERSMTEYINNNNSPIERLQFDLIIASNSLHFSNNYLLNNCMCFINYQINPKGLYYISIKEKPGGNSHLNMSKESCIEMGKQLLNHKGISHELQILEPDKQDSKEGWTITFTNFPIVTA